MIISLVFIGVFAVFSCLLSASETALTASSSIRLNHLHKQGFKRAVLVIKLQAQMSQVIATILLANTIMITSLTALATNLFMKMLGEKGVFYAAFILSALITIYLEVLPKILVFPRAERTAMKLAPMVHRLNTVLAPLTRLINNIARLSLRLARYRLETRAKPSTLDELKWAIDAYAKGDESLLSRIMLKNILDLTSITVQDVMIPLPHIFSLHRKLPNEKLVEAILGSPFTRIPLWENTPQNIIGLIHVKQLVRHLQKKSINDFNIEYVGSTPWLISPETTIIEQLQAFREKRQHLAFVTNAKGAIQGLVTLEDILEEIVGDIKDEHDMPLQGITLLGKEKFLVDGTVTLRELNREHDWELPENLGQNLSELIVNERGYVPQEKQMLHLHGLEIKVLKRTRHHVTLLEVTPAKNTHSIPSDASEHP